MMLGNGVSSGTERNDKAGVAQGFLRTPWRKMRMMVSTIASTFRPLEWIITERTMSRRIAASTFG